jgi:pilus assembly protein Flp/PilA
MMRSCLELIGRVAKDQDEAPLLEYTVPLGILLVTVIATITLVGAWISGQRTALHSALP